jgi:hypothetical protein
MRSIQPEGIIQLNNLPRYNCATAGGGLARLAQGELSPAIHASIHARRSTHYLHDLSIPTMDRLA